MNKPNPYFSPAHESAAFEACKAWLSLVPKIKTPTRGTYSMKHRVEEWTQNAGGGLYIWEDTFIRAALEMGFNVVNKRVSVGKCKLAESK